MAAGHEGGAERASSESDAEPPDSRPLTVIVAIIANLTIMVAKAVTAILSGSAAMLAEAVHSAADTANQGIIIFGIRRSRKPPDCEHPFGYGKEIYFWTLVYAGLLFAVGGGISVYEGIVSLLEPQAPGDLTASYIVLAVALVAEGISWTYAVRTVSRRERGAGFFDKLFSCKDPSVFVVVGEDTAAILGILTAFAGLSLTQWTGLPQFDAAASILIGLFLGAAAVYLTAQTKRLLLGQAMDPDLIQRIHAITRARAGVEDTGEAFTMHVGPNTIFVAIDVLFSKDLCADEVAAKVDEIEAGIRALDPRVSRIFVEAQRRTKDLETPTGQ